MTQTPVGPTASPSRAARRRAQQRQQLRDLVVDLAQSAWRVRRELALLALLAGLAEFAAPLVGVSSSLALVLLLAGVEAVRAAGVATLCVLRPALLARVVPSNRPDAPTAEVVEDRTVLLVSATLACFGSAVTG